SNNDDGDYLDLPNGMISANGDQASFEFWATWFGPADSSWQEFMSFGTSDGGEDSSSGATNSTYIMLTPRAGGSHDLRAGYRYGPTAAENVLDHTGPMPRDEETHVVFTWDKASNTATLYVNGQFSDDGGIHFSLADDLADDNNWLGRSQWNDPLFAGGYNEVRIYDHVLTAADVLANYQAGPNAAPATNPAPADRAQGVVAGSVTFGWQAGAILPGAISGYDFYLGEDEAAVAAADASDTSGIYRTTLPASTTHYLPPDTFQENKTFFWRIDERCGQTVIGGAVWRFQTPQTWAMKQANLMTRWSADIDPNAILPEYPRPQMVREDWLNLNGIWQYQPAAAGEAVPAGQELSDQILVPFPVESAVSGVMEHHDRLWYRRLFTVPPSWSDQRILLHCNAADWETEVFINGSSVGTHQGGYDPFAFDITEFLAAGGENELIVRVYDPTSAENVPRGKQDLNPSGIWYTSATGIWDTIWLEPVPQLHIARILLQPDVDQSRLEIAVQLNEYPPVSATIQATALRGGQVVAEASGPAVAPLVLPIADPRLWSPHDPFLYDLQITLRENGQVVDAVDSYFGMRKVELRQVDGAQRICLNGEFLFQIGPLDQGYWPDGIYRACTDEALKWDLEMIKAFGFNMLRKHVKVEPPRWYYWADKLGLLVWQDMPSMRSAPTELQKQRFEAELEQLVADHRNHPSIIMWVVFNEGWGQYDTVRLTEWIMDLDPQRLVSCASGWTDYDVGHIKDRHGYPAPSAPTFSASRAMVCGEYGGIAYFIDNHVWDDGAWGYTQVYSAEELVNLYGQLFATLSGYRDSPGISGGVYTQITDVEIEINGLITYDRAVVKADPGRLRDIHEIIYSRAFEILPTSQQEGQIWKYSFETPPVDWYETNFDDTAWNSSPGGFGTSFTPGSVVRTTWDDSDIWLRRTFDADPLAADEIDRLFFHVHHDEDVQIYLNGVLAASAAGYTTNYVRLDLTEPGKAAFRPGQTNVLAVHCSQTTGGQYIDVGLSYRSCICTPWDCFDLNGDYQVTMEDLFLFCQGWLHPYDLQDYTVLSDGWLLCR
ncbi:MAG: hypothetical protein JW810_03035, partial [Sedimentisphaerales bacterium]|nr:hypothetical protein [Sedimentisphaerales bacterium]